MDDTLLSPTDFVALLNQTLEYAYPRVIVQGELANFRVSKNKWVYFDLKDEMSSVKCFGTVYQLPGPLEDGMLVKVAAQPRLHSLFGFSLNIQTMMLAGVGSIKKAAALLEAKLQKEGLFDDERKRRLPYPPERVGLIASSESAAYSDFVKVLKHRWNGLEIQLYDVQVQGQQAPDDIVSAIRYFNDHSEGVDVLVVTRGGGSADDLAAFSTEQVTRAVAASRTPTLVAVGHERDISLAELAADVRASTPSNAAELLVPDRLEVLRLLKEAKQSMGRCLKQANLQAHEETERYRQIFKDQLTELFSSEYTDLKQKRLLLDAYNPTSALRRGYALIRKQNKLIKSVGELSSNDTISISLKDGQATATIDSITEDKNE